MAVRQLVHCAETNIERPWVGVVDRKHVNGVAVVGQLPAGPALVRVPAWDNAGTADAWEVRESAECLVTYAKAVSSTTLTVAGG